MIFGTYTNYGYTGHKPTMNSDASTNNTDYDINNASVEE